MFALVHSPLVGPLTWKPVAERSYAPEAEEARRRGWAVEHLPGLHLHQLVEPDAVAERIVTMTRSWVVSESAGTG